MKAIHSYKQVKARTASPAQRVVMLYDGIIKNLRIALNLLEDSKPENLAQIHDKLQLASQIVLELKLALDLKNGGELADNLDGLYSFWGNEISEANVKKDPAKVRDLITPIADMRDAWDQAEQQSRRLGAA